MTGKFGEICIVTAWLNFACEIYKSVTFMNIRFPQIISQKLRKPSLIFTEKNSCKNNLTIFPTMKSNPAFSAIILYYFVHWSNRDKNH